MLPDPKSLSIPSQVLPDLPPAPIPLSLSTLFSPEVLLYLCMHLCSCCKSLPSTASSSLLPAQALTTYQAGASSLAKQGFRLACGSDGGGCTTEELLFLLMSSKPRLHLGAGQFSPWGTLEEDPGPQLELKETGVLVSCAPKALLLLCIDPSVFLPPTGPGLCLTKTPELPRTRGYQAMPPSTPLCKHFVFLISVLRTALGNPERIQGLPWVGHILLIEQDRGLYLCVLL